MPHLSDEVAPSNDLSTFIACQAATALGVTTWIYNNRLLQPHIVSGDKMELERLQNTIDQTWDKSILERLEAYIRIPNESPDFDPQWEARGHMEAAVQLMADWCRAQPI